MLKLLAKFFICFSFLIVCQGIRSGPLITATKGEVWPKPQKQEQSQQYYILKLEAFHFQINGNISCPDFLNDAFKRYWDLIAKEKRSVKTRKDLWRSDENFMGYLDTLNVELNGECPNENIFPKFGDDESYNLTLSKDIKLLSAPTAWGILRGLETFSQLVYSEDDTLVVNVTTITDFPRFPHRGFLLDTARHFQPLEIIYKMLDALSFNKFNVFHWHIVDDHSFPYQSRTFPELSQQGAYHPSKIYSLIDIKNVIEYARLRGIRVIPEFDTPGHTRSWGVAYPELLTTCYSGEQPTGELGPMDPTKGSTYEFVNKLFTEVVDLFPDEYFHIGGDEVDFECWKSNQDISKFMVVNNITDYVQLESLFIKNVINLLNKLNSKYLVWEEVFVNGVELPNSTVVHVWRSNGMNTLSAVTKAGKFGLYSSCWYLSDLLSGGDWTKFYNCNPHVYPGTEEQNKLILGGEACMWGEYVNEYSVIPRVWPRASAIGERLWSSVNVTDNEEAKTRLEEHTCRMNRRGIDAQPPTGAGVCL